MAVRSGEHGNHHHEWKLSRCWPRCTNLNKPPCVMERQKGIYGKVDSEGSHPQGEKHDLQME